MNKILAPLTVSLTVGTATACMADPAELDSWCLQAKQPSSTALCSDPELRELAIQRNHAFEAARARLSVDAYDALLSDQKGWVHSSLLLDGMRNIGNDLTCATAVGTDARMHEACRASTGRIFMELRRRLH
jgi:hypothetical protein